MENDSFRIESDFLGEKENPVDAYYGVQTQRDHENFPITEHTIDKHLIKAVGIVKKAAAKAKMEVGQLDEELAKPINEAADEVLKGRFNDQFILDPIQGGAGTSSNMNANEVVANRALELIGAGKGDYEKISPSTHVNMSQSTKDVFPTR